MSRVPLRFVRHQGSVLRGMGELALAGMVPGPLRGAAPTVPGEWLERVVPPPPAALVDAYVEHVGGRVRDYEDTIPAHLFPHWALAMSGALMRGVRQPLVRAVNGGCRLEVRGPLPRRRPLVVRGRLAAIDDDGRRALITQRFTIGVPEATQLVVAELRVFVPLSHRGATGRVIADRARDSTAPSEAARELGTITVGPHAGWEFALLTGDFNPIHWARPWARVSGFGNVVLHGFGTFARVWEVVRRADESLCEMDVRFTKPLVLPARAEVWREGERVWVRDARDVTVMEGRIVAPIAR